MENIGEYRLEAFPKSRLSTIDIGRAAAQKHHMRALLELDVTEARKKLREAKKENKTISFNSWLIKCISLTVEDFPRIHGIRKGKTAVALFDDVDISVVVERDVGGEKVPLPYVLRKTNKKTVSDICGEIRSVQRQEIESERDYVLGERKSDLAMKLYYLMPGFLRKAVWNSIIRSPFMTKRNMGTVIVTSVGMMGRISGWVIPVSVHPLCFAVGSIIKKPGVKDDRIEAREYLYVTVLADHDVIDGAPAVRALSRFTELVESGYGLPELQHAYPSVK